MPASEEKTEEFGTKRIESAQEVQSDSVHQILQAMDGLRFGNVNIIIQDGVIVQIDRTEKRRLKLQPKAAASLRIG